MEICISNENKNVFKNLNLVLKLESMHIFIRAFRSLE